MGKLINFRDFGTGSTKYGGRIKPDRLFRSGHFIDLSDADLEYLLGLELTVIADLRYEVERASEPSPWPPEYTKRILYHGGERAIEAPHMVMLRNGSLTPAAVEAFYHDFYRNMAFDPLYRPLYARTVRRVAQEGGRLLVHCAAGKDRTGIFCALLLDVLGVSREDITTDFLCSANAPGLIAMKPAIIDRALRRHGHAVSERAVDALLGVRPDYIDATFATIQARYGSVAAYFAECGVDEAMLDKLRADLIEG